MTFHVFVEGAADGSPEAIRKLSEAIAARYGLRAADLIGRMSKGRFRVKGNVDRITADQYVRELTALGARCTIEEAAAATRPTPPPPRASTPPPVAGYQSGLAAAFSSEAPAASLGALDRPDAFSLMSVDGAEGMHEPPDSSFEPPPSALPAKVTGTPEKPGKPEKPKSDRAKDVPLDLFVPPDAGADDLKLELATDDVERNARKQASTPGPLPAIASDEPIARQSQPTLAAPADEPAAPAPLPRASKLGPLGNPRVRLVVGAVLAILLGFVPAHVIAASRERSTFAELDRELDATQQAVDTPEAYDALDKIRSAELDRKTDARRKIALLALVIWGAVGGGLGYAWFRRVPWDRL